MSTVILTDEYLKGAAARSVPDAYYDDDEKAWVVDDIGPRGAAVALKLFPELVLDYPELEEVRDSQIQDVRPFDNAEAFNTRLEFERAEEMETPLYDFQAIDMGYEAAVIREHGGAYIGWERGLGKTLGALALVDELRADRVLIVASNTAKRTVWAPEIQKYLPRHELIVLPNEKKRRERELRWLAQSEEDRIALVVHYESLALIANQRASGRGWDQYGEWDLVIADEAHRIKNPKAKMTRALKKIPARGKVALSGTIIANHADELFSPLQWLFPDRYRSKWRDWNDRFLDYVDGGFSKVCVGVRADRIDELRDELGVFMVYRRKEDELDLPERTDQTLLVDLTAKQRKVYDDLRDTCLAELESGERVWSQEGLTMLIKLRQVATGLDLISEEVHDSSKLDVAIDMIEENPDEAFVVFSWFKAAAYALAERLAELEPWVITGDVRQEERADALGRFQEGEGRVLIGTISTMGESVNLQRANNAIFLDRSWNPGDNVQAEDRIYRIGQGRPVTITHLVAKDTVDEHRVMPTIRNKEALRRMILGGGS